MGESACVHANVVESTNGRPDRRDDSLTHWLCLDCGDRFPLVGDTDLWETKVVEGRVDTLVRRSMGIAVEPLEYGGVRFVR